MEKKGSIENIKEDKIDNLKDKLTQLKTKIDKFQKKLLDKFDKYIIGIALLPPKKEEKDTINLLVFIDDSDTKKMPKLELKERLNGIINKIAEESDKNIKPELLILSEMRQNCYDCKWEFLQDIAVSISIYDPKDVIAALRVAEIHKQMVLKKFEKYVVSYVAFGSLFRGEKSNDIDVYVIIDDTDVKRMPRFELKEKLRAIILSQAFQANDLTKVQKKFHVQVYILTDFWEGIKDANPIFFTLLRDGIPLYDRSIFMPWKLLLETGRIKPSPEAIDMFMSSGEKILKSVQARLKEIIELDIYWAVMNPSQAALMLYGLPPSTPKETVKLLEDIFVKKEKLLELKYVKILDEIRQIYKDLEHDKIKELKGAEIDRLLQSSNEYLERIKKLFEQIEKKKEKELVKEIYDSSIKIAEDALKIAEIKTQFPINGLRKLVEKNEIPSDYLNIFKNILKCKQEYLKGKLSKQEIIKLRKESGLFVRGLVEYIQRKKGFELTKASIRVKTKENVIGEVLLLNEIAFIIRDVTKREEIEKADYKKDGSVTNLSKSSIEEMEEKITEQRILRNILINEKTFSSLKEIFGNDVEILL